MQNFLTKIFKQLYYIFLIPLLSIYSEINAQSLMLLRFKNHTNYATGMVFIVMTIILCYIMYIEILTWRSLNG